MTHATIAFTSERRARCGGGRRSDACWRRCATSVCTRRRTAAVRRASAGAAPCGSTVSRGSRVSRPLARVAGRSVTTLEGLPDADAWGARLCATGGSQCGFCTPGIVMRLAALPAPQRTEPDGAAGVARAPLSLHRLELRRRRGMRRGDRGASRPRSSRATGADRGRRDPTGVARRCTRPWWVRRRHRTGRCPRRTAHRGRRLGGGRLGGRGTSGQSARCRGGAPPRHCAGRSTCRRATGCARCRRPGWSPRSSNPTRRGACPAGNRSGRCATAARSVASSTVRSVPWRGDWPIEHERPVLAIYSREDVVRFGAKRPPMAAGVRADGTGVVRVARTPGIAAADRVGRPRARRGGGRHGGSADLVDVRAAGWAEAAVLLAPADGWVTRPESGARAHAAIDDAGAVHGAGLVRRGARRRGAAQLLHGCGPHGARMGAQRGHHRRRRRRAAGPHHPQLRRAACRRHAAGPRRRSTPSDGDPVNGSDAVFAAVALAAWRAAGFAPRWPTMRT